MHREREPSPAERRFRNAAAEGSFGVRMLKRSGSSVCRQPRRVPVIGQMRHAAGRM